MAQSPSDQLEQWLPINNFPGYEISVLGNVRSVTRQIPYRVTGTAIKKGRPMFPVIDSSGYKQAHLRLNGKTHNVSVHRLVATHFIPNPENKPQINHKNGIKTDNRLDNLEWCTHIENIAHSTINGFMTRNGPLPYCKLVLDNGTGIFYNSITEAALAKNIKGRTLHHWLSGERRNKSNLILV